MNQINDFPPNYKIIKTFFNLEGFKPIFTYGNTIYNPHNAIIDKPLFAHESEHMKQQEDNPKDWWKRYLIDSAFRASQEIPAYQKQYQEAKKIGKDRETLNYYLVQLAKDLSSPMYGSIMTFHEAHEAIKKERLFNFKV